MLPGCNGHLRQLLEVSIQAGAQRPTLGAIRAHAREHDEIPGRQFAALAKRLTSETLELVTVHGSSGGSP
jgi:hypothetical protein